MLGEELWISRRPRDAAMFVSAADVGGRAGRGDSPPAGIGCVPAADRTAVQMALTLVYWQQMVRYFDRRVMRAIATV